MIGGQQAGVTAEEDEEGATARTGTDRTGDTKEGDRGTEKDNDPWWPNDLVRVLQAAEGGAGRRKWMVGRVGHLIRQAQPGQWMVALEGERGCGEYDIEQEALEMAQRRAPTSGDLMACRTVDGGAEVKVQLTRRTEGSSEAEEWTAARLDSENFARRLWGAHSGRIGGATDLASTGKASELLLKAKGRWASDIGKIYARMTRRSQLAASRLMHEARGRDLEEIHPGFTQGV